MPKKSQLVISILIWLSILAAIYFYALSSNQSINDLMQNSLRTIAKHSLAPLLLMAIFIIRPILLLPVSILSAFSGYLFGPVLGIIYALIASSVSASIAFAIAFYAQKNKFDNPKNPKLIKGLKNNSFESVLISRLTFIPGDLVNYSAGFLKIDYWQFLLATAIGGLPGLAMTVLAGASIDGEFNFSGITINIYYLISSMALLVFSLLIARYLRKRKKRI